MRHGGLKPMVVDEPGELECGRCKGCSQSESGCMCGLEGRTSLNWPGPSAEPGLSRGFWAISDPFTSCGASVKFSKP
jgi:hypothetical protein